MILTPICAHDMRARSFVLSPGRTVTVVTKGLRERRAVLSVDGGKGFELCSRDELTVKRSKNVTIFASVDDRSFYQPAYSKLAGKTGP